MKRPRNVLLSIIYLLGFHLFWMATTLAAVKVTEPEAKILTMLNQLRHQAGLRSLNPVPELSLAAQNHAKYLVKNFQRGHFEQQGLPLFSGSRPADRAVDAGYVSRFVMENVSVHSELVPAVASIDGLMSAIYHRFAFLTLDHDLIGIGQSVSDKMHSFVFKLGNSGINSLCQGESFTGPGRYYLQICADKKFQTNATKFDQSLTQNQIRQAAIILWPAANSHSVLPGFYKEDPDPLPQFDVSGYPISVQFNPALFVNDAPKIQRFELFRLSDNEKLKIIKTLNKQNDQHQLFTPYQHAIFPHDRLDWKTEYRVEVDYLAYGNIQKLRWNFSTADPGLPIKKVTQSRQQFLVKSAEPLIFTVTPKSSRDGESGYRTRYSSAVLLQIKMIDPHSLKVEFTGDSGEAEIFFHGKTIVLKMHKLP